MKKEKKITKKALAKQINNGLKSIKDISKIIIAYEPVWSIGTGLIPKSNDLFDSISYIKSKFNKKNSKSFIWWLCEQQKYYAIKRYQHY